MKTVTTETDETVVVAPAAGPANATVIWMHGLGADGYDFVPMVPELNLPEDARVRFVFPHAEVRPVTVNAGYAMRAWYDIAELTPEGRDDERGLVATRARIEACIAQERVAGIASKRIVLAGFSQGGAVALHVGLRHAEPLCGIIALSCYLPMRQRLAAELHAANRATPILMCHGREDVVVLPAFGEQSRDAMLEAGLNVEWHIYSMAHSLCHPEVFDISAWLQYQLALIPGYIEVAESRIRRIATEEAFSVPEVVAALRDLCASPSQGIDMMLVRKIYGGVEGYQNRFLAPLLDIEQERLRDMDANGVDMQLLSLTAPGVQMFDADTATELAIIANDRLAEVIARHPARFAGLASFAPHSPKRAVLEMERAVRKLKLNGFVVNSHTNNEYLDDPKYWPILEAAEALDRCIYIHPRGPSEMLSGPMRDYGMFSALWAYGVEVSTHAVRLILSGVFDRFPRLKICIGHMGEAVHFWLWRIDFMSARAQGTEAPMLKLKPSEYFRRNFVITTSGQESPLALDFSIRQLGIDNVMWAIDYPYQPTGPAVAFMDGVEVPESDRRKLYHQNAERVFHIPP